MRLFVATTNPGKLRDFRTLAQQRSITIDPLPNLATIPAPPEDEPTFEANAATKAIYYSHHAPNEIVIADDSGLEVPALNNAPGVHSARYADDQKFTSPNLSADARNNQALLQALTNITDRQAHYRCALAAARNGTILHITTGTVPGEILHTPRGTNGFGYDPIFFLPPFNKSMAEIEVEQKQSLSHRGRAFSALLSLLTNS